MNVTTICKFLSIVRSALATHSIYLSFHEAAIVGFNEDFVHLTADHIDQLVHIDPSGNQVTLKMKYKLQLRALLVFHHAISHKNGGGLNIYSCELLEFKEFRNGG